MNIEKVKVSKLRENPKNPRRINDIAIDKLCKSIKELPSMLEIRPIVIDDNNIVLGGNARLKAVRKLGYDEVPVIKASELTEDEKRQFILKDNTSMGDWDFEALKKDFSDFDFDELMIDFPEIDFLESEAKEDNFEEPKDFDKDIFAKRGDIFEINVDKNKYRIGCLDCTNLDDLNNLFDNAKIDLVLTDPPYGVDITKANKGSSVNNGKFKEIKNDNSTQTAKEFYNSCISLGINNYVIWGGNYFTDFLSPSRCWIIWDKEVPDGMSFARGEMAWTSFDNNLEILKQKWSGNNQSNEELKTEGMDREKIGKSTSAVRFHPTQKTVGMQIDLIKYLERVSKQTFNNIFDGFCGGGGHTSCWYTGKEKYLYF